MIHKAYRECKILKLRNYTYANWSTQPKYFDSRTLSTVFESGLNTSDHEMRKFIEKALDDIALQCFWHSLTGQEYIKNFWENRVSVVNCAILRKLANTLL